MQLLPIWTPVSIFISLSLFCFAYNSILEFPQNSRALSIFPGIPVLIVKS